MKKPNLDLRLKCRADGIPLWLLAQKLGVSDQTLLRNWRTELSKEEKQKIVVIIDKLVKEGRN